MKSIYLLFLLLMASIIAQGQTKKLSEKEVFQFKKRGFVQYSDFGAEGDGETDDVEAIVATHTFANQYDLRVQADEGYTYYIGGKDRTAIIQTDTDFGRAQFLIDDTKLENRKAAIFEVRSSLKAFKLKGLSSLKRNQEKVGLSLSQSCLITVTNTKVKHYIRFGRNQNSGSSQTDIFIVDQNGKVDMDAPIIWDFDQLTDATALPIDEDTLSITGGRFTTIANQAESKYNYHSRNILIKRSKVVVDSLEHRIIGEGEQGAPYRGFISIQDCAYVSVRNTTLTGHKMYKTIGSAGKSVPMGSYDLSINRALNVSLLNCSQTNSIDDRTYWGILSSNYCKNLLYDHCTLSRFDAHKGVANATIRNSTLGHMGINAIGSGTLTVENTTVRGRGFIQLRPDYGSTWQGNFIIRNCTFVPKGKKKGKKTDIALISGLYSGSHDFGYTCYMPEQIIIEDVHIDDSDPPEDYQATFVFSDFNPDMTDNAYKEQFPYVRTKQLQLKNISVASEQPLRLSQNVFFFEGVEVIRK
ncbi:MAG: hypothetical protein AAF849_20595 [Bacteroidota bacterium]